MSAPGDAAPEAVLELLRRRSGLVFPPSRRMVAAAGIRRAMEVAGVADADAYAALLLRDPGALSRLLDEVTVGETYFFRDPAQWEVIRRRLVPEVLERRGSGHVLRAWSAACSTGEEPYSLAILCQELGLGRRRIVGTDVSRPRLEAARAGRYSQWSLRGVPEGVARAYFTRHGDRWELDPAVRAGVEFAYLNLADDGWPSAASCVWEMDLVLCRNVLIYLAPDAVARTFDRLLDSLAEGGWLVLGASDPSPAGHPRCEVVVTEAGLFYRRTSGRRSGMTSISPIAIPRADVVPRPPPAGPAAQTAAQPRPTSPAPAPPAADGRGALADDEAAGAQASSVDEAAAAYAALAYPRAAEVARSALAAWADAPELRVVLVRALANQGALAEAEAACADALDRFRTHAELHYLHGVVLAQSGRHAEALAAARQALFLDPELAPAHVLSATAALRLGQADGARRALRNAERVLVRMAPDAAVPAADGETADRLLRSVRTQLALLAEGVA